tara:strand:- start:9342 stop:9500 length:159 start_codon:yes stop_codon:yes gene_type:complete
MIENILELLSLEEWMGQSENIEIAKGKYKIPLTIKAKRKQLKRQKEWQLKSK